MSNDKLWTTITESRYPWEREALDFVRSHLPEHEPYRSWANFEFIADDGSINEVDLLVFTPQGFFLVEIKSRPGRLTGDAGTWTWVTDGRAFTVDNPLIATNLKAKKLASLLQRQRAFRGKDRLPFLEPLLFCSGQGLQCQLEGNARFHVCVRDREETPDRKGRAGIIAALTKRDCPGLDPRLRGQFDKRIARAVSQALEQAGIRPTQSSRTVSNWVLDRLITEGPNYQDWEASHPKLVGALRRIRLYQVRVNADASERQAITRSAIREAQLAEMLQHEGILDLKDWEEHELGPALVFEHDASYVRLDHFITERSETLSMDERLRIVRQIAEVIRFAHDKKVIHRALSPQSVLIRPSELGKPTVKIFNWMAGYRTGGLTSSTTQHVTATSHIERLVDDGATAYMAPEALGQSGVAGEHLDVFSLGTLAYLTLTGRPPAASGVELSEILRSTKGLQISSVLNGAGEWLQDLIQYSTHPEVPSRIDSVADFLEFLDKVEEEFTATDHEYVEDPAKAQKGDELPGGYEVIRRLGQGACSVALLVRHGEEELVLKAAISDSSNTRLEGEAEILQKLHHQHIVKYRETLELGGRTCILMERAGTDTLGQRLRKEGRLHVDLLQRFGEDLLSVANYLEEQGIQHRDIKPDNIGVGPVGRGDKLHLVLFDFSLSRTPVDNLRAGTTGYLDPLLPVRKPARWDLHAERYAAAATLYELAAGPGNLPVWGDGTTDPSHLDCEATIDPELFDAHLRDQLAAFFERSFRREPSKRFDNAEEMLRAWRHCFENIEASTSATDSGDGDRIEAAIATATFETAVAELHLGARASNALDRANIITVADLLNTSQYSLNRLRGVGNRTRKEIADVVRRLKSRLGAPAPETRATQHAATVHEAGSRDVSRWSIDMVGVLVTKKPAKPATREIEVLASLLALSDEAKSHWPSQSDVAHEIDVTPVTVHQALKKAQGRWKKEPALTRVRDDLIEILRAKGGVYEAAELADALLVTRGSIEDEPRRSKLAVAVTRAAVEVERTMVEPRLVIRRDRKRVLVALDQERVNYACRLGNEADSLAAEDPLASPARVLERLRAVGPEHIASGFTDRRLLRLGAAASQDAALSSRQELYPRGMDAARALKLSQGALLGVPFLTVEQVHERVRSRYPEASVLPGRPQLDALLKDAGLELRWESRARDGRAGYVSPFRETISVTTGSGPISRLATIDSSGAPGAITPDIADARQFEERLQRADSDGSFLALLVHPKHYQQAAKELVDRFSVELIDFEGLFIEILQGEAAKANVKWDLVLGTDARPGGGDWNKLVLLVNRVMPKIEAQMDAKDKTMLVIFPGMLARYDQMQLLERLRDKVGRRDGIHGVWLLIPGDQQPLLNGKTIPILGPGQRVRIPESWLKNVHRANGYCEKSHA
jgi:serine/threonine protein kinase